MLNPKSIYLIYLIHKLDAFFGKIPCRYSGTAFPKEIRLKGYLSGSRPLQHQLSDDTIVDILNDLNDIIDDLPLLQKEKPEFPRTLNQFNNSMEEWQNNLTTSHI